MTAKELQIPPHSAAIILAGGLGKRMGREKQYLELAGRPMLEWSVEAFSGPDGFEELIVVLTPENLALHGRDWEARGFKTAPAGATRIASLKNGFKALSPAIELVAVHDGARPLADARLVASALKAALKAGASVPGVPLKDTVKRLSADGLFFEETLDRSRLMAVQTPQCYRKATLSRALKAAGPGTDYSDESQILEKLGIRPAVVLSDYRNIKVTTPEDLIVAEAFMKEKTTLKAAAPRTRFGFGYDIHRLVEGRALILGGVRIEHPKGMLGHSDGDAVLHAVCDALLGSVAAGEIGIYFPPTDLTIMGLASSAIAEKVLEILKEKKASIINIDATIVAEEPKLKPHYENIRKSVARIFKLDLDCVSIKAKSREGLGDIGHGGAIACYAVAGVLK
ncbi:MAG: 2-C-methyl-D-erythritol 4-phosphate cytidylyltransferase [Elusimicrobiales bacterium]|jgi:2-C-methyl-D-erythritol 4-phosphate cytidylyltransferase/2-C-methyl-D-erythritol 2,4-cyclodiphosphate synthase